MLEDTLEMDEDEEVEEEADAEVDKVLFDLTNGKLGEAGSVSTELPVCRLQWKMVARTDKSITGLKSHCRRRGNGEDHGEIPRTTQWFTQRLTPIFVCDGPAMSVILAQVS
jgi:hypothetical protein